MSEQGDARWWVMEGYFLRDLLIRAASGEDPNVLLLEIYANSDTERVEGDDG